MVRAAMHIVDVPQAASKFYFPDELCCNCGTRDDVTIVDTDIRRTVYVIVGGIEDRLRIPLPFCTSCAITAEMRPPGVATKVVLWMAWVFLAWCAAMGLMIWTGLRASPGYVALALAVGVALLMRAWFRRKPLGQRTSNYQPVRFLGARVDMFGPKSPGTRWAFSNGAYAALVAERARVGVLPEARTVKK